MTAKAVFLQTMERYAKLDTFSTDIEHDFSSGLFPGKYRQHLEFKRGKGFKLVAKSPLGIDRPKGVADDYYCDGAEVTSVGRFSGTRPINKDNNTVPGYEVTGGLILTWLLDSPTKGFYDQPPKEIKISVDWGKRKTWHNQQVVEVIYKVTIEKDTQVVSFFLDPSHVRLIGDEAMNNGKLGYMLYQNQKVSPKVNEGSFKAPSRH
jgi:hypothetical protein